jgi:osmotically-inducible protein OsmY
MRTKRASIIYSFFAATLLFMSCGSRSDRDIETDVSVKVHPSAPDITVSARNGIVYLSGMVKDSANWKATLEAARSVTGVKDIDDKLHIATSKK